jgi:hypothetical protein
MGRLFAAILLVAVLAIGGGSVASTAYQAGLDTAVTSAAAATGAVVAPVVVQAYGYGYGLHPFGFGFGILGFLGALFFLFIVFGLIRAILWRGGPHRHGWGRDGWGEPGTPGRNRSPWEARGRDAFDAWHRRAHDDQPQPPTPTDPA